MRKETRPLQVDDIQVLKKRYGVKAASPYLPGPAEGFSSIDPGGGCLMAIPASVYIILFMIGSFFVMMAVLQPGGNGPLDDGFWVGTKDSLFSFILGMVFFCWYLFRINNLREEQPQIQRQLARDDDSDCRAVDEAMNRGQVETWWLETRLVLRVEHDGTLVGYLLVLADEQLFFLPAPALTALPWHYPAPQFYAMSVSITEAAEMERQADLGRSEIQLDCLLPDRLPLRLQGSGGTVPLRSVQSPHPVEYFPSQFREIDPRGDDPLESLLEFIRGR